MLNGVKFMIINAIKFNKWKTVTIKRYKCGITNVRQNVEDEVGEIGHGERYGHFPLLPDIHVGQFHVAC